MKQLPNDSAELQQIYDRRFSDDLPYRDRVWQVLTRNFFSKYVAPDSTVLDLGCGYGHFINNIRCATKYAMDLNPAAPTYLSPDVKFLHQNCAEAWQLADNSLDVVFTSNFFEHLPSKDLLTDTLTQARRCLRPGGRLIAMGPNIKYVGGAYWDFWDHHLALSELSLTEGLEILGFALERVTAKFLPYTMVNQRPYPLGLISLYLMFPPAWKVLGKQFLLVARKPQADAGSR